MDFGLLEERQEIKSTSDSIEHRTIDIPSMDI